MEVPSRLAKPLLHNKEQIKHESQWLLNTLEQEVPAIAAVDEQIQQVAREASCLRQKSSQAHPKRRMYGVTRVMG